MSRTSSYASGSEFSTSEIARASARLSPARTPAASDSRVQSRRAAGTLGRLGLRRPLESPCAAAGEHVREQGHEREDDRDSTEDPARPDRVEQRSGNDEPEAVHGVVDAHDDREDATADV